MSSWSIPQEKLEAMPDYVLALRATILALVSIDHRKKNGPEYEGAGLALDEMAVIVNERLGNGPNTKLD